MRDEKFSKEYPIRYFELDCNAELHFGALLDFLQDIAGEDAVRRGFGVEQLLPRGLTWMLSRYRIELNRVVGMGECLQIRTWPSKHKGLSACREFEILSYNELIGVASTAWMLIDLETRRPVRPHDRLGEVSLIDQLVFSEPLAALKFSDPLEPPIHFRVRYGDLDLNRHVNNRVFYEWAVEALPPQVRSDFQLQQVNINYLAEALAGEEVSSACSCQPVGEQLLCSHLIRRPFDAKDLARIQTLWVPRNS